jgi:leucyl-tRNA synthetase
MTIAFKEIELKWKKYWEDNKTYKIDLEKAENTCYSLVMFPYPSADKLHLGHWFNYAPADTWSRFRRMNGFSVFQPMGFDAFGLPAENYAVKTGIHPKETTKTNIDFIRNQLKAIGAMYDWDHEVNTSDPEYYKWTQWLFLQFFKNDLAYKREAPVNWDPVDQTVLANEQVLPDGTAERSGAQVIRKMMSQWFLRITDYGDKLLAGLEKIEWPEKTKLMQQNWIGRSEGAEIDFAVDSGDHDTIKVYTTRPDTLFGATYMVIAPEHSIVSKIVTPEQKEAVEEYIHRSATVSEIERTSTIREKSGVFTGAYAINPVNDEKIPIWIADYVLVTYGTGAIMAVPAHDERDFEFATQFNLPIRKVILQEGTNVDDPLTEAYTGEGTMVNSGKFDGIPSLEGIAKVTKDLNDKGIGQNAVKFKFRDWLISRQRYWGVPIPIIYCPSCGEVAVPDKDLPVLLPDIKEYKPKGLPPLATSEEFVNTTCPECGKAAKREVDTMDTFVDSSWYFLRYTSSHLSDKPWDPELVKKWLPVDQYIGGVDHATMHLLYARFFVMALHDMGHLSLEEPFKNLVHQGIIKGPDGFRMSKSRGNVINPEPYLDKYGSDIFRTYLMFGFDFMDGGPWDDSGIAAIDKFINRVWRIITENIDLIKTEQNSSKMDDSEQSLNTVMHNSIKVATRDLERFHFNTAISRIMELVNALYRYTGDVKNSDYNTKLLSTALNNLILLLAPFTPHLSEEMWEMLGGAPSVFDQKWPSYDESALKKDEITWVIQINGKIRERAEGRADMKQEEAQEFALNLEKVKSLLSDKQIRKVIVVPKKLINIVAN